MIGRTQITPCNVIIFSAEGYRSTDTQDLRRCLAKAFLQTRFVGVFATLQSAQRYQLNENIFVFHSQILYVLSLIYCLFLDLVCIQLRSLVKS